MTVTERIQALTMEWVAVSELYLAGDKERLFDMSAIMNRITVLALEANNLSPMGGRKDELNKANR